MTMPAIHPCCIRGSQIPAVPEMKEQGRLERKACSETPGQLTCKQMKLDSAKGSPPAIPERLYKLQQLAGPPATLLGRRSWKLRLETRMLVPIRI